MSPAFHHTHIILGATTDAPATKTTQDDKETKHSIIRRRLRLPKTTPWGDCHCSTTITIHGSGAALLSTFSLVGYLGDCSTAILRTTGFPESCRRVDDHAASGCTTDHAIVFCHSFLLATGSVIAIVMAILE
jgi:hypothetical protein